MSVFFNSLPNYEFSNIYNVATFSNKFISGKTSLPVKYSYLPTFCDDKADVLAICYIIYII